MNPPPPTYNPRRFRTNVPFYARYRLSYPDSLVARVAEQVGLEPGDAVMDLGCGPGSLAVPFARLGMNVIAIDPEPDMVEACRDAARESGHSIDVRQGSSFDLPADFGPFKLVAMGRSFHWMDRDVTLEILDRVVARDGALTFFDDDHPPTSENAWRRRLREIGVKFGRNTSPHVMQANRADFRTHQSLLLDSAFAHLEGLSEYVRREISADDIVGLGFSLSTSSPERLGEELPAFESELRNALAELSLSGHFTEIAELTALVARRP